MEVRTVTTRVDLKEIGPFKCMRLFVPDSTEHATFAFLPGVCLRLPKFILKQYWPEEPVSR